jgi:ribosome-associated protein
MTAAARMRTPKGAPKKAHGANLTVAAESIALKEAVVSVLEDYKADNIVVLPLAGQASFADYLVVASGTSTRHVASMGGALEDRLDDDVLGMEGQHEGEWVCVDMGAVVVHLFLPEKREHYNLEKLWSHVFDSAPESD